jgi:outer membrane murein-binding lipoprotein Lpp
MTNQLEHSGTALATRMSEDYAIMPVLSIEQAVHRYNTVLAFVKQVLVRGRDYGTIPGTEKRVKPGDAPSNSTDTLLKPGAEKLSTLFGFVPHYEEIRVIEDFDKGLFYYVYRCTLLRNGEVVGEGIGSANSREKKYARGARVCPDCGAPAIKRSKFPPKNNPNAKPGWYCYDKSGGCGMNFDADDERVHNESATTDPGAAADLVNTLQKMGQKRAFIGATTIACNVSDLFTQDMEDAPFVGESHQPTMTISDPPMDETTFLVAWDAAVTARNFPTVLGRGLLSAGLKQAKIASLANADQEWLKDKLDRLAKGDFDATLKKKQNAQQQPAPAAESPKAAEPAEHSGEVTDANCQPFPTWKANMIGTGTINGASEGQVKAFVRQIAGVDGAQFPMKDRKMWLEAAMDNRIDYLAGRIIEVEVAGA